MKTTLPLARCRRCNTTVPIQVLFCKECRKHYDWHPELRTLLDKYEGQLFVVGLEYQLKQDALEEKAERKMRLFSTIWVTWAVGQLISQPWTYLMAKEHTTGSLLLSGTWCILAIYVMVRHMNKLNQPNDHGEEPV